MAKYDANREFRNYLKTVLLPQLKSAFESGDTHAMADLLGDYTVVAHPDGERSQGKGKISAFFKFERGTKSTIEFDVISTYTREVSDPGAADDDIWHIGHAVIGFTGCLGTMALTTCHPRSCVWEP
ncbi:hypothetical protein ACFLQZ_00660 [Acidobacteriota bacterium]